jgi:hypothetical protein
VQKYNNDPTYFKYGGLIESLQVSPNMRSDSQKIRRRLKSSDKMKSYVKHIKDDVSSMSVSTMRPVGRKRGNNPSYWSNGNSNNYQSMFNPSLAPSPNRGSKSPNWRGEGDRSNLKGAATERDPSESTPNRKTNL